MITFAVSEKQKQKTKRLQVKVITAIIVLLELRLPDHNLYVLASDLWVK